MSDANEDQRQYWNSEEAAQWVDAEARYDEMLEPFATALLDAGRPTRDTAVLDVGCGTGGTTLAAARRAADATALGIDISRPMIEGARRRAEREEIANATFEVRDAQVDPFEPTTDLLVSRFGVMFFADPVAAFTNLHRALAPGGRLAFVCWQPLFVNEWMTVPALAVAEHIPLPEPPGPGTPGPFSLGDADLLRSILATAGFSDVAVAPFETSLLLGGKGDVDHAVAFLRATGMGRTLLTDAPDDAVRRAVDAVHDALAPHHDGEGVRLGAASWIVTGSKS